jgi:hypothetical protein
MTKRITRYVLQLTVLLLLTRFAGAQAAPMITSVNWSATGSDSLTVSGANFASNSVVRVNGHSKPTLYLGPTQLQVSLTTEDSRRSGSVSIAVFTPALRAMGGGYASNVFAVPMAIPAGATPALGTAGPVFASPGASQVRLTLTGTNFRPGAAVVISPPLTSVSLSTGTVQANDISVQSTNVTSSSLIVATITVGPQAVPGLRAVDVLNLDGTNTGISPLGLPGTSQPLRITPSNSLGAPLSITTIALLGPRNGAVFAQGEEIYGQAQLAGTGSGAVVGAWFWDNSLIEQFTVNVGGGQSVSVRSNNPFPTELLGQHTLELRILQPGKISSRPISVVVNPGGFSLEALIAPANGARITSKEPPELRWAPVPGIGQYQVGFADQPYLSDIHTWYTVSQNSWSVPSEVWRSLPDGELYWTVRSVEMSGVARRPLPMRSLLRVPDNALKTKTDQPSLSPQGNPLLEWNGFEGQHFYRITISSDPEGQQLVRRYLTSTAKVDLRALRGKLDPSHSYYWHVEVLDLEGRSILTGPTNILTFPVAPQSRNLRGGPSAHLILASYSTSLSLMANPIPAPDELKSIATRIPAPDATASNPKAPIVISFSTAPNAFDLAVEVDDTDVTSLCDIADTKITYTPATPVGDGPHKIVVTIGPDSSSWKFTMKAAAEPKKKPDGEVAKAKPIQMQTQIASNTQWVSGSSPDINTVSISEQLQYQNGPWKAQINGSGLLNSFLGPQYLRTSHGYFDNYILNGSWQKGKWGLNVSFGEVAPSLYQNAQFVTTAAPRQGVEADLKTPAGIFGFFSNTDDVGAGCGFGYDFLQQIRGASWDLPFPKKYLELRLMWLSAHDDNSAAALQTDINDQTYYSTDTLAVPSGGDLYGALLQVHLSPKWLWTSEYGWGYNDTSVFGVLAHESGRAARTAVTGSYGPMSMAVGYFDVSPNFASPTNPNLSPDSTPDRRGPSGTFVFATRGGVFSFSDTYLQSGIHQANLAEQNMTSATESWSRNLNKVTVLSIAGHETFTTTGDVPAAVQAMPSDQRLALEADQRDGGFNVSLTRQVGKTASLTFNGGRDWFRNNLIQGSNTITTSGMVGANWLARPYLQINGNVSLNWFAGAGNTVGTTRGFSGYLQPTLTWKRTGMQLQPLLSINQSRTMLIGSVLANDLLSQQYGGRFSWTMPRKLKFSTLSFDGELDDLKNPVAAFRERDTTLYLLWTITWGYKHEM